jgi:hypothetical protein
VTFAVYGTNGQLVDHQTEIFAHSADPNIKFYNTDSRDASFFYPTIDNVKKGSAPPIDNVNEGFSSYTLNGIVTFLIQSDLGKISAKPITLYSGSKLIYDSNISPAIQSLAIGFASGDSADNVNQNVTLPTSGSNITGISWKSSNPEVVSSTGIVHPPGVGSGDANVTVTAKVYSSNLFVSKPFHLVVKASLPSGDASLSSLNLSGIILDQLFNGNINAYTATVSNSVSVTTVKYAATDSHTMVALQLNGKTVNNPVSLSAGSNVVRIIVTAQNGNTQTYTLIVTRTVSNIASLSSLNISQGDLTPMFSSANPNYTVEVPNPISSLELSLTKADPSQTLTVTGAVYNTVTNNVYSYRVINLIVGSNPIQIMVIARDGTQNTYNISVNRASIVLSDLNHDGVIDIIDVIFMIKQNSISLNRENVVQLLKLIGPKYVKQ